jgi:hypothetical protein
MDVSESSFVSSSRNDIFQCYYIFVAFPLAIVVGRWRITVGRTARSRGRATPAKTGERLRNGISRLARILRECSYHEAQTRAATWHTVLCLS